MIAASFAEINNELLEICAAIRALSDEDILHAQTSILKPSFSRLDRLAARKVKVGTLAEILASAELKPVLSEISRLRNIYGLRLEIEQAHELLTSPNPWTRLQEFTFYENYLQLAAMEQQGAGLNPDDRIIFLGSGPLSLSLILLSSRYGLTGIGIERENSYVELSRQVVKHLGLTQRITIINGDHFALPLKEEFRLLMVAVMARPKEEIFQHLAHSLPDGSLLSFRLYEKGLRRLLDLDGDFILPPPIQQLLPYPSPTAGKQYCGSSENWRLSPDRSMLLIEAPTRTRNPQSVPAIELKNVINLRELKTEIALDKGGVRARRTSQVHARLVGESHPGIKHEVSLLPRGAWRQVE